MVDLTNSLEEPGINPTFRLFLPQGEASKAVGKKTLEGVTNKEGQAAKEEKVEGIV